MFPGAIQYRSRKREFPLPEKLIESSSPAKPECSEHLRQYLYNSTLHGLRYVGEVTITFFER